MSTPVLHVIAGPNGAGKTTFHERVIVHQRLPFVNADLIAAQRWPHEIQEHAYEASKLAHARRDALIRDKVSFVTETVFSHESKAELCATPKQSATSSLCTFSSCPRTWLFNVSPTV